MIKYVAGDILKVNCQALVNPVNCVGVMGKGLALQFKKKYPEMYQDYKRHCEGGNLNPGEIYIWEVFNPGYPDFIYNAATKNHWNSKSEIIYVQLCLQEIRRAILDAEISSIAIPALGCGEGGLRWNDVKPMIDWDLQIEKCEVFVYLPRELWNAS
jgi:O-acetyl-ADP-ribose deacetylase (regulator of RNase III)